MRNLKLTLSYDGTRYQGVSAPRSKGKKTEQDGKGTATPGRPSPQNTVAAKLADTFGRLTGEQIDLFCGAKTDSGVHALAQVVSFHTACPLSTDELCHSLNHYLPQDIRVCSITEVPERFHASLNARAEIYECRILNTPVMDPFLRRYALHVAKPLDVAAMEAAAEILKGKHDFLPFSSGKAKKKKTTERELTSIKITAKRLPDSESTTAKAMATDTKTTVMPNADFPCEIRIRMTANHFLYQMPRLIVGTLVDVGLGERTPDCIGRIFKCEEKPGAPCAAHGLYLKEIHYYSRGCAPGCTATVR
jgi:tRNA pseudouridine38-40 synthase